MHSPRLTNSRLGSFLASRWMLYGPVLLFAALIAGGSWYGYQEYQRRTLAAIEAAKPKALPDPLVQTYSGKIRARNTVLIPAPIDGTLESVDAADGDEVFEGQLLGKIQNTAVESQKQKTEEDLERAQGKVADLESQLLAARLEASRASADLAMVRSSYESASKAFDKMQRLYREGAAARKTFEKSEADFRKLVEDLKGTQDAAKSSEAKVTNLQASVEEAKTRLREATEDLEEADSELLTGTVKAPVSGLLIGHRKNPGEQVTRDIEDLFEIASDLTAMDILTEVPPELAKKLKAGGRAFVQIAEAGEAPLNGTIREINDNQAIVEFTSPSPTIKPGMTAQVRFLN
jgi:HlyD family secretion protein